MKDFQFDDLDRTIPQTVRDCICDVVLSWATYDVMVSSWVVAAFGLPKDAGSILLGNMDTRAKLDKLRALYKHLDVAAGLTTVAAFNKRHAMFVDTRNTIAHASCRGVLKSEPDRAVFSFMRAAGKGRMLMSAVDISEMRAATLFANEAAERIFKITEAIEDRLAGSLQPSP